MSEDAIFPVSEEGQRYRQVGCAILTIKTQVGRGVHEKGCVCCAATMGQLASCLNDPQTAALVRSRKTKSRSFILGTKCGPLREFLEISVHGWMRTVVHMSQSGADETNVLGVLTHVFRTI